MLEAPPLRSLFYIYVCGSLRFSIYIYVYGLWQGEGKAFGRTQGNIQCCSESAAVQQNNQQSQCVLLALCVCALGRGLTEKVLGLGQRSPPPPLRRGVGSPPPPPYSPPNCRTPLRVTHWLAAAPVFWP